jgi:hypothetical protein
VLILIMCTNKTKIARRNQRLREQNVNDGDN